MKKTIVIIGVANPIPFYFYFFFGGLIMTRNNINKAIRSILGISGAELGRDIGYTRAAISIYNRGIGSPELQDKIERYIDKRVEECPDEVVKRICRYLQEERKHAIQYPALYY